VKIIKPGIPKREIERECTCTSCGCVFTFKAHEARYVSDFRDGDFLAIHCPQDGCKAENFITP